MPKYEYGIEVGNSVAAREITKRFIDMSEVTAKELLDLGCSMIEVSYLLRQELDSAIYWAHLTSEDFFDHSEISFIDGPEPHE